VRVALHRGERAVELSVADTGVGIARDEQGRVFERFFRSSLAAGRSFEGSGIGLALVSELVHLHGGTIAVQSTPGVGSTFTVTLPVQPSTGEQAGDVTRRSSTARSQAFAADAHRWIDDVATKQRPDVIVSDVMMPGVDGLHLVDRLRADAALHDVPVLLLSGRAGPEAAVDGLARGADDYLVKPFSAKELRARIRALLDARERASRATTEALAGRRRAEELAGLSASLHSARIFQAIADASFAWLHDVLGVHFITLSVAERDEPMLRRYFAGIAVPAPVVARYLRTPAAEDTHSARALRDGIPRWVEDFDAQTAEFPELAGDLKALRLAALATIPLRLETGTPFAVLAIGWNRPVQFDADLTATLQDVESIVTAAARGVHFAEVEQSAIQRLESNLLAIATRSTRVIVRARHQGSDMGVNVGGDWYDAIDLGGGRVAVAVGDVVGHGLDAVRTAVRLRGGLGLAALDMTDPTDTLSALDRYAATVPGAHCTTVALAVVDPAHAGVSYSCAGHPPPILVSPAGQVTYLEEGRSWPLGPTAARPRARAGAVPARIAAAAVHRWAHRAPG
jgi:CheY-like chemotaxis protein